VAESGVEQYACSVGHVYSPDSLDAAQERMVEGALWAGARLLEDRARFLQSMAERATRLGHVQSALRFGQRAEEALARSRALLELVESDAADEGVA
jgi:two-component system chemotaxis response regulator CheB